MLCRPYFRSMAEATVRAFKRTGFNSVNVPKNFTILENAADQVSTFAPLDLCQRFFLNSIRVKVRSEDDVMGVDYITIGDSSGALYNQNPACYSVHGHRMAAPDVAELYLVQDSWMDLHGYDGIESVLDGLAVRKGGVSGQHYPLYTLGNGYLPDEMLVPSYPLALIAGDYPGLMDHGIILNNQLNGSAICVSTADLASMQDKIMDNTQGKIRLVDFVGPTNQDTSFKAYKALLDTAGGSNTNLACTIHLSRGDYSDFPNIVTTTADGVGFFFFSNVRDAIDVIRSFGLEDAISDSYQIPTQYINGIVNNGRTILELTGGTGTININNYVDCYNVDYTYSDEYAENMQYSGDVYHPLFLRSLLGEYNRYILASIATGNKRIIEPQDLPGDIDGANFMNVAPVLYYAADPQPNGCPYFNIRTKDGVNIYENGVKGENWRQNAIRYTGQSGEAVKRIEFENEQEWKDATASREYIDIFAEGGSGVNYVTKSIGRTLRDMIFGPLSEAVGIGPANLIGRTEGEQSEVNRFFERQREREAFEIQNAFKVPEVSFMPSTSLRDAVGNGAFITRMVLDPRDLKKFDRIQTQFGIKVSEPLTKDMLNPANGGFKYIEAKGVSLQAKASVTNATQEIIDDVAKMFSGGIRIWGTRPDVSLYTPQ